MPKDRKKQGSAADSQPYWIQSWPRTRS
jgi:hypothetical protein